ncbi:Thermophilic serine proteinase precursor [compost metagenome]
MKNVRKVATLSVVATALSLAGCGVGTPFTGNTNGTPNAAVNAAAVPGEILVKFRPGISSNSVKAMSAQLGMKQVGSVNRLGVVTMKVTGDAKATIAKLQQNGNVLYAEPNYMAYASDFKIEKVVNDPRLAEQWAINKISAPAAWDVNMGSKKTLLAIVDTGVDYNHPDLAGRVDKGYDFINNDEDAMDDQGHGTHCAGIAAAGTNDGVGIAGLAPGVSILAVKVLSASGGGSYESVASGITYAADRGAHVISMSLGGGASSQAIQDAVNYAISKGSLVVAAMGNNGRESKSYPAACDGVMAIGATDVNDAKASFSQYGSWISVGAPGHNILSTIPGNKYAVYSGTSMATPYAAGLASLVKSQFPSMTAAQIKAKIEKSATDVGETGFDKMFGHGRINAAAAVK